MSFDHLTTFRVSTHHQCPAPTSDSALHRTAPSSFHPTCIRVPPQRHRAQHMTNSPCVFIFSDRSVLRLGLFRVSPLCLALRTRSTVHRIDLSFLFSPLATFPRSMLPPASHDVALSHSLTGISTQSRLVFEPPSLHIYRRVASVCTVSPHGALFIPHMHRHTTVRFAQRRLQPTSCDSPPDLPTSCRPSCSIPRHVSKYITLHNTTLNTTTHSAFAHRRVHERAVHR